MQIDTRSYGIVPVPLRFLWMQHPTTLCLTLCVPDWDPSVEDAKSTMVDDAWNMLETHAVTISVSED